MGPQKTIVPIAFAAGLDTKTDPKQVLPGKLLDLQNGIFQETGAISRRWGYTKLGATVLGSSAAIASAVALNAWNDELLLYDGTLAYSYLPSVDAWASRGGAVSVIQTTDNIIRNTSQQLSPDFGTLSGVDLYVWEDSRGGLRYSTFDAATGTLILGDQPLYPGTVSTDLRPKVVAFAAAGVILVFFGNAAGQLLYVSISPGAPARTPPAANIVLNGLATPVFFDACVSGSTVYLAYYTGAAVMLAGMTSALAIPWTATVAAQASVPTGALNVTADASGQAWVTYADAGASSSSCSTAVYSAAGAQVLAPVQVVAPGAGALDAVAAIVSGTTATVFAEAHAAVTYNQVLYTNTLTVSGALGAAAAAAPVFARSVGLASKPFAYAGATYVNVAFESPLQSTYFTLDTAGAVIAKASAGLGGGLVASSDSMLPECPETSAGVFRYANLVKGLPNTEAGQVLALLGVQATTLDFAHSNGFLSVAINGALYTVGGVMQRYDGARYVEHGFHVYPETAATSVSPTGGAMGPGDYDYAITYEWTDQTGAVEYSTPSTIVSVTIASGTTNSVTLTVPTLRLTKKDRVRVVIYRTQADETTLYRVTSAVLPLYNDPTVDTVTFVDTLADTDITSNGAMYTQPLVTSTNPVLENVAPPACSLLAAYDDRLWVDQDGYTLLFTKPSLANTPMEFAAEQTFRLDPDGGPMTALARMDDKLVIFKESAIFYLSGQGPTPSGDQSGYSSPVGIPSGGVGCASQSALVLTPIGLMFQSANGIYLLDRGLNVSYKGAPVEKYTSPAELGLTITSATLLPNQWVLFMTSSGTALVYDFFFDQWSTFTNHAAVDSDVYLGGGNVLVWAKADGSVYEQTRGAFSDAGAPIPLSLTTAWLNPGQIQGFMRVYHAFLLGTYKGSHTLNVWAGFDYDDAFIALAPIPVDTALGVSTFGSGSPFGADSPFGGAAPGDTVYQFRLDLLRKCQSIRFQISDQQSGAGNEGFSLSALSLVIGVKAGGMKLRAGKQFGVQ